MKDLWQKQKQKLCSRKLNRCKQHCSDAASFRGLAEQLKDFDSLIAQSERKVGFRGKEEREYEALNRVACGNRQVEVHEMWMRK